MNKLKTCPFCGGEADVMLCQSSYGQSYRIHHEHASPCPAAYVNGLQFRTEAEAIAAWNSRADYHGYEQAAIEAWESIKAWNSRAERTCKHDRMFNLVKRECDGKRYSWRDMDMPNYCPNCGCKVVSE